MKLKWGYRLSAVGLVLLLGVFYGCAGREYAPKGQVMVLPQGVAGRGSSRGIGKGCREGQGMPRGVRRRGEDEERRIRYLLGVPYRRGDRQGESGDRPREWPLPEESGSAASASARPRRPSRFRRTRPRSIRASAQSSTGRPQAPPARRSTRGSEAWIRTAPGRYAPAARRNIRSPRWAMAAPGRTRRRSPWFPRLHLRPYP